MVTPGRLALSLVRGDTFALTLEFVDVAGVPLDLTGRAYAAQIRSSPDAVVAVSIAVVVTDAPGGIITLGLSPAVTALISEGGVWDLQETDGDTVTTLIAGTVALTKDVTRVVAP